MHNKLDQTICLFNYGSANAHSAMSTAQPHGARHDGITRLYMTTEGMRVHVLLKTLAADIHRHTLTN